MAQQDRRPAGKGPASRVRRLTWRVVRVLGLAYAGTIIVLYLLQSKMLYFPQREIEMTPGDAALVYEDVTLQSSDGVKIAGWYVPAGPQSPVVLFCHGNAGNISHRIESLAQFNRLGLSVLIFDYRGYGQSAGKCSEKGTYLDAEAAWRYLTEGRRIAPERIIVFGRSLGGAIAAHLARDHAPGALIVESSFTSVPDRAAEMLPLLPVRWLCRFRYSTAEYVREVDCPLLVVHSVDDELIGYHHGRRIYEAASPPKELLSINGGHNDGFIVSQEKYLAGLTKFLDEHIRPQARPDE